MTYDPFGARPVGRRSARLAEKKRKRTRNLRFVSVAAAVAVLVTAAVVLVSHTGGKKKAGGHVRTQQTMLLQIKAANGKAIASALLAHDPASSEGAVVLVPPQVIVTVPGAGSQAFGDSLTHGQKGSRDALSDLMGVTIDGSWVLDHLTFARLVDQAGGIDVTVDAPVVQGRVVLIQPGQQHLDGAHALAFATYLGPGEPEQSRLNRFGVVLDGLLTKLPVDPTALLRGLGRGGSASKPVAAVAALVAGLKTDDGKSQLQYRSLPVVKIDAGTDEIRFRIDQGAARALVDDLLADSVPAGVRATGNRVLVLNGVGTPGLGDSVRAKLVPAGFVFVGSRNAPTFGYAHTLVLVKDATTEAAALGARVARALGVPASSVQVSDQIGTITDVVVIVGKDFHP